MKIFNSILLVIIFFSNLSIAQSKFDHSTFDGLLKKHVDADGWVNYEGIIKDKEILNSYLDQVRENPPDVKTWSRNEQLAYWINAYNAFTLDLVTKHYPLQSIKDIGSKIQIPFVISPWDKKFIYIKGRKRMDLNNIEHGIIRKKFNEPRIHFAVNCASYSCPVLRNEAYVSDKLDSQLDEQARKFINDPRRNKITPESAKLSKLFSWYGGDFTKETNLKAFIAKYSNVEVTKSTMVSYLKYQWQLNSVQNKEEKPVSNIEEAK